MRPCFTAFATRWGNSWRVNTVILKGDSMSGLAGDHISVIAFGWVFPRPHPHETRTGIQKAHHHHAILIFWLDHGSCRESGLKPSVFCRHVQQCEQCVLEIRQPVSDQTPDNQRWYALGPPTRSICFQWNCNVGLGAMFTFFGHIVLGIHTHIQDTDTHTLTNDYI